MGRSFPWARAINWIDASARATTNAMAQTRTIQGGKFERCIEKPVDTGVVATLSLPRAPSARNISGVPWPVNDRPGVKSCLSAKVPA